MVHLSTLLSASLLLAFSHGAVPWMCDCEADMEHCGSKGLEKKETCKAMVEVARELGFDDTLPPGSPGAMLAVDPKMAHLIGDYCNFMPGVQCDEDGVYALNWDKMALNGTLPSKLNQFSGLTSLYLTGNSLHGDIPDLHLPKLEELLLSKNRLSGSFPVLQLPKLWKLYLDDNKLTGTLPFGLAEQIPQLRRVALDRNEFEGHIPFDLPFFNNSNSVLLQSSIMCSFSGNHWSCPIEDFVKAGTSYNCEYDKPITCTEEVMV